MVPKSYPAFMNDLPARSYVSENQASLSALALIKKGIWLYFILLIFEGALRKWVLPSLSTPLLIIRDPLALWIIFMAWKNGYLKANIYLAAMITLTAISIFTAIIWGHGNLFVALFGARVFFLHFPLLFIIGYVFNRNDVLKMGTVLLWISIPMAILIAIQFYSPQSAWVNLGVGGDTEGAGFSGSMGYFRPPGTFSFITGTTAFFSIVACYVFFFWMHPDKINRLILTAATIGLLTAIPFSISRSLFFSVGITTLFTIMAIVQKPEYAGRLILIIAIALTGFIFISQTDSVSTALEAFTSRFETANEQEGGIKNVVGDRFLGGMFAVFFDPVPKPLFGYGIGMGTNVGAMLLTGGQTYLIAENEWGRIIGEQGILVGLGVLLIRLVLCWKLFISSYQQLREGNLLPWILLNFALINLAQGQWGQPTSLGFSILITGLVIASLNHSEEEENVNLSPNDNIYK